MTGDRPQHRHPRQEQAHVFVRPGYGLRPGGEHPIQTADAGCAHAEAGRRGRKAAALPLRAEDLAEDGGGKADAEDAQTAVQIQQVQVFQQAAN